MFEPKIQITNINAAADKWTVADITGVSPTDPTGYGQAAYLPANNTIWVKEVNAQYLGALPVVVPFNPTTDNVLPSAEMSYALQDGVYLITEYFARNAVSGLLYTVDVTKKILTKTGGNPWIDPLGLFAGVYGVVKGNFTTAAAVSKISSVTATTLTLATAIPTLNTNDNLTIVYKASKYILITTQGSNKLIQNIGDMALSSFADDKCDPELSDSLFKLVALKTAIQIHFNCGNYAKAHNGAVLLSKSSNNLTHECSSC